MPQTWAASKWRGGRVTAAGLAEVAEALGAAQGWDERRCAGEVARAEHLLRERHGVVL